jgi:hypothetical protein
MADQLAEEALADLAEPAVDFELILVCAECKGTGTVEYQTGTYWADYTTEPCRWCQGTGAAERHPIYRELPPAA